MAHPTTRLTWRGVTIPPHILSRAGSLDALEIVAVPNAELRRVLLENRGIEDALAAAGARTIHADTDRGGDRRLLSIPRPPFHWSVRIHRPWSGGRPHEDIVCLRCRCPTTGREYLLIYYLREFSPPAKISEVVQRSAIRSQKSGRFLKRPWRAAV